MPVSQERKKIETYFKNWQNQHFLLYHISQDGQVAGGSEGSRRQNRRPPTLSEITERFIRFSYISCYDDWEGLSQQGGVGLPDTSYLFYLA